MEREPCPHRIIDDTGTGCAMGAIGGGLFHFLKGHKNSPKGSRLVGASQAVRMNAPRIAGSFAVWGGIYSLTDCSLVYLRQKEDPWNSIIAGAFTGGFLQLRQGFRAASQAALFGGLCLGLIEGFAIAAHKLGSTPEQQQEVIYVDRNVMPMSIGGGPSRMQMPNSKEAAVAGSSTSGSWFGGWFGLGGKKDNEKNSEAKTEVLENFDAPMPPTFEFK
ncbi:hypothetical protein ACH5RR_006055 [Cinchona calisaya]|uniref:Uncharacterized protein n=1 Tax=Cinchona calisaya TaxID=153742 RepID=A0ABD3AN85_9GENT